MQLNFNFIVLFVTSGTTAVVGNILLKAGMNQLGNFDLTLANLTPLLTKFVGNWQLIIGFALYGFSSVLYLKLITAGEITKIYPAIVSYMFIMLLLLGSLFLRESFTLAKALGVAIIILGIFTASR